MWQLVAVVLLFCIIPKTYSQEIMIQMPATSITIEQAIKEIETQTQMHCSYGDILQTGRIITFPGKDMSLDEIARLIAGTTLSYKIEKRRILFYPKKQNEKENNTQHLVYTPWKWYKKVIVTNADSLEKAKKSVYMIHKTQSVHFVDTNVEPLGLYKGHRLKTALKTNLLYAATTTPNVGIEFAVSDKVTFDLGFDYNGFKFKSKGNSNPKLMHWSAVADARLWFCRVFEGTFIGVHGLYGQYNVENIPIIRKPDYRAKGYGVGGGISIGHHWALGKSWGFEMSLGVGAVYLNYDKYTCGACGTLNERVSKMYYGPTKSTISLIYFIR